jgi:chitin disaccharide deacetylase
MPEPRRLIVNADDLGLHEAVNRGIFRAHRQGVVTSASILAGGEAFFHAVQELKTCPNLGLGVHLCLVDQRPVLDPKLIPSLVDFEGHLPSSYLEFTRRYVTGGIKRTEIQQELQAQVERVLETGLQVTHLDSHQHLHMLSGMDDVVLEIGIRNNILRLRLPTDKLRVGKSSLLRRLQGSLLSSMASDARRKFESAGFSVPDHFAGFSCGGDFRLECWRILIPHLPEGSTEVMVHPGEDNRALRAATGWDYHWEEELQALISPEVKEMIAARQATLINFGNLP